MNGKKNIYRKVTIKDLAKKTGYSLMTISRALNNSPLVREKTRKKIIDTAEKLGYIRDAIAVSLVRRTTRLIGLVITDSANPFYARLIHGIENEAVKRGYHVVLYNTNEELKREIEAIKLLIGLRAEGLLIVPCQKSYDHFLKLKKINLPFIAISRRISGQKYNYIFNDNIFGSYLATKHLLELGHKRIAFLGGEKHTNTRKERLRGYKKALKEYNIDSIKEVEIDSVVSYQGGMDCFDKMMNIGIKYSGMVAYNDVIAMGIISRALLNGYKIPEDFSVVGYDNIEISEFIFPRLTTISQDLETLGKLHCDGIIKLINNRKTSIKKVITPRLIIRDTTAKPGTN